MPQLCLGVGNDKREVLSINVEREASLNNEDE